MVAILVEAPQQRPIDVKKLADPAQGAGDGRFRIAQPRTQQCGRDIDEQALERESAFDVSAAVGVDGLRLAQPAKLDQQSGNQQRLQREQSERADD